MSKESKRSAREALAEERARQSAADKRKQRIINTVIVVVVAAVVVGIFVAVQNSRTKGPATATLPATVTENGGPVTFGDGPVTVTIWEDFQCPACKQFESVNSDYLEQAALAGDITLAIQPLSFIDQNLGNTSSVLAANAFACSMPSGDKAALDFHQKIYANQPKENPGNEAWDNATLIGWANDSGVTGSDFESCVNDGTYNDWVQQVAAAGTTAGITGTPTVLVDGKKLTPTKDADYFTDPSVMRDAVAAAQKG